jgi:hypothetical protein
MLPIVIFLYNFLLNFFEYYGNRDFIATTSNAPRLRAYIVYNIYKKEMRLFLSSHTFLLCLRRYTRSTKVFIIVCNFIRVQYKMQDVNTEWYSWRCSNLTHSYIMHYAQRRWQIHNVIRLIVYAHYFKKLNKLYFHRYHIFFKFLLF